MVIPFVLPHTYRQPVGNAQMANFCTNATFQQRVKYAQVKNVAETLYYSYILSTVRA